MDTKSISHFISSVVPRQYVDGDRIRLGKRLDLEKHEIGDKVIYYVNKKPVSEATWCRIHRQGGASLPPECRGKRKEPQLETKTRKRRRRKAAPSKTQPAKVTEPPKEKKPVRRWIRLDCKYPLEKSAYRRLSESISHFDDYITAKPTKYPSWVCLEFEKWDHWPLWFPGSWLRANRLGGLRDHLAIQAEEGGRASSISCWYFIGKRITCDGSMADDVSESNCARIARTRRGRTVCNRLNKELDEKADSAFWKTLLEFGAAVGIIVALKLLVGWLRGLWRRRGRDGDDDNKGVSPTKPNQPDWNAMVTPQQQPQQQSDQAAPFDWNNMSQPQQFDWNAMVQPQPQADLKEIGGSMFFQPGQEGGFELSSATGMKLRFSKLGQENVFTMENLANSADAIPLAYYWLQAKMATRINYPKEMSRMFNDLANAYGGTKYLDEDLGYTQRRMGMNHLFNRMAHQLENGFPLFDVEANVAHVAAFFQSYLHAMRTPHDIELMKVPTALSQGRVDWALDTLKSYIGNLYEQDPSTEGKITKMYLEAPLDMAFAEYYYREACCEVADADRKEKYLKMAKLSIQIAGSVTHVPLAVMPPSITTHIANTTRIVSGACDAVGIKVPGYGPTSATVQGTAGMMRIVPLTRIGMGR